MLKTRMVQGAMKARSSDSLQAQTSLFQTYQHPAAGAEIRIMSD